MYCTLSWQYKTVGELRAHNKFQRQDSNETKGLCNSIDNSRCLQFFKLNIAAVSNTCIGKIPCKHIEEIIIKMK